MVAAALYDRTKDFDNLVYRNIVSLRKSVGLFDDLTDGDEELSLIATQTETYAKRNIPSGLINRSFHYTTSIGYPFETQPFMATRYSDGSFPAWYGSLEQDTTIHETAYHMYRAETAVEGVTENVVRERAVYQVSCRAILIDLSRKKSRFPNLVSNDYSFTQSVGKRVQSEGHPGLIVPSARYSGYNVVIFKETVLSDPKLIFYLSYIYNPNTKTIRVERDRRKTYCEIFYN